MKKIFTKYWTLLITILALLSSCDAFTDVDDPSDKLSANKAFVDISTIESVVNGLYTQNLLSNPIYYYLIPLYSSALADDSNHTPVSYEELQNNSYSPTSTFTSSFWTYPYQSIYISNNLIEKLDKTTILTEEVKKHYIAEAKYFRAYNYFVLTNFFGDVPLILTTSINENASKPRTNKAEVWKSIIDDLIDAETGLANSTNTNIKVTQYAAKALLARSYLYTKDYVNAEKKANDVIVNSKYKLDSVGGVFLRSSKESIFKTSSSGSWSSYVDRVYWGVLSNNSSYNLLTPELLNTFNEEDDLRKEKWITLKKTSAGADYYHSAKYRQTATPTNSALAEDFVLLRLGEQFLIRAEARANLNKLTGVDGAIADIDSIRIRAGLAALPSTLSKEDVLLQVEKERRRELFLEEAHRWWDVIRTGRADLIFSTISTKKWQTHKALLPIPDSEIKANPSLTPNPGYGTIQ